MWRSGYGQALEILREKLEPVSGPAANGFRQPGLPAIRLTNPKEAEKLTAIDSAPRLAFQGQS